MGTSEISLPAKGGNLSGITGEQASSMDPETRLMVVCYQMLGLLDARMQEQMDVLQARNDRATELKGVLNSMNDVMARFDANPAPDAKIDINEPANKGPVEAMNKMIEDAGLSITLDKDGKISFRDLDAAITKVTGMMDSNTTIQQLDMFTLQSVFSKRNENFELMSNSLKKSQDTKSSLIRNF